MSLCVVLSSLIKNHPLPISYFKFSIRHTKSRAESPDYIFAAFAVLCMRCMDEEMEPENEFHHVCILVQMQFLISRYIHESRMITN